MKTYSHDISLVLGGAAGQGIQTVEALLMKVLKQSGYHAFSTKEYMSRIRGGSNSTEIRITNTATATYRESIDFLFAMDKAVIPHLEHRITENTLIFGDTAKLGSEGAHQIIDVPFSRFAAELGNPIFTSTVAVGVALGLLGVSKDPFEAFLKKRFAKKGEEVVVKNIEAAEKGYTFGSHIAFDQGFEVHLVAKEEVKSNVLMSANDALGLGALAAGCNYVSSYPMSPGTALLTFLSVHSKEFGVVVDQAEDEISAINHVLGAWYAGARGLVTTSGGGFALMCEGVSLAGMIETPVVIHIGMRPGPATGLPTRTEQADLDLALYSGHGEFPRAIYAPGSAEECFAAMQEAFRVADAFQGPTFILTDQYLLDSIRSFPAEALVTQKVKQHIVRSAASYQRYQVTDDGISPRAIPGFGDGLVALDSDEHDEEGRITESHEVRQIMQDKRWKKFEGIKEAAITPTIFGDTASAQTVVVAWGSNKAVLEEALQAVNRKDLAGLHFMQVFPLATAAAELLGGKRVVVLENNTTGQFARLLRDQYEVKTESLLQYNGNPFSIEQVTRLLQNL
jgi:2-oxoglutarate ferredoxin oxidoreductase subunit alpha